MQLHLLHRHPGLVRSALVTGVAAGGLTRAERLLIPPQLPLWRRRWYWRVQAVAFRIPSEGREVFVETAVRVAPATNRRTYFPTLAQAAPQLQTWVAPGMHHPWNIEDPGLFTAVIREFVDTGGWRPADLR